MSWYLKKRFHGRSQRFEPGIQIDRHRECQPGLSDLGLIPKNAPKFCTGATLARSIRGHISLGSRDFLDFPIGLSRNQQIAFARPGAILQGFLEKRLTKIPLTNPPPGSRRRNGYGRARRWWSGNSLRAAIAVCHYDDYAFPGSDGDSFELRHPFERFVVLPHFRIPHLPVPGEEETEKQLSK
jgi:hypothetical protein